METCCIRHIPERCSSASLLLLHACCSSVLPLCCCSAAQVQLVWLCNHWVRLHCCTLPVLLLKLLLILSSSSVAWLGLKSSLSLSLELVWLGYLGRNIWNIPLIFLCCFKEKVTFIKITVKVFGESWVIVIIH